MQCIAVSMSTGASILNLIRGACTHICALGACGPYIVSCASQIAPRTSGSKLYTMSARPCLHKANPLADTPYAASPARGIPTSVAVAADVGAPRASTGAGVDRLHGPSRHVMTAPHLPAALGARVHVEGHGLGTYVRFDFNLSRVAHTIDFDEGGEKMLRTQERLPITSSTRG